eukprot:3771035-Pleurochrysis_carterae.AAC.3
MLWPRTPAFERQHLSTPHCSYAASGTVHSLWSASPHPHSLFSPARRTRPRPALALAQHSPPPFTHPLPSPVPGARAGPGSVRSDHRPDHGLQRLRIVRAAVVLNRARNSAKHHLAPLHVSSGMAFRRCGRTDVRSVLLRPKPCDSAPCRAPSSLALLTL